MLRRAVVALVVPLALVAPLLTGPPAGGATPARVAPPERAPTIHSSDGVRGPLLARAARTRGAVPDGQPDATWQVTPGVDYRRWTVERPQGAVRLHLLQVDLTRPGVALDLLGGATVAQRQPLSRMVAQQAPVAAVNADFFDIDRTGAPLGVGVSGRALRHGPSAGWNHAFYLDATGRPRIGDLRVGGSVTSRGRLVGRLVGWNSPPRARAGVHAFTRDFGVVDRRLLAPGSGAVRQVVVRDGRVVARRARLAPVRPAPGTTVLVGLRSGAAQLSRLRVGRPVVVRRALDRGVRVAVGGSVEVLRDGAVRTRDRELHPRTAVGIDARGRTVYLLLADGRSESSGGLTLVQLARLLRSLGADDALNLDGGGSSTMVAPDELGATGVRNQPSDGVERPVPNGLAVLAGR